MNKRFTGSNRISLAKALPVVMAVAVIGAVIFVVSHASGPIQPVCDALNLYPNDALCVKPVAQPLTQSIVIANMAFSPAVVSIKKGTTVTWTNNDNVSHTVTSGSTGGPSSGTLSPGKSYSFTLGTTGSFDYHCSFHPEMQGSVTVTE